MVVVLDQLIGTRVVTSLVIKVAPHDCAVLIRGESGTGKELVARSIQKNSKRRNGPFVTINCGAIPDALTESILFGHEKGAFTGASADKRGLFESANGGTIFLDEIGEMPLITQVKLLRALQEREIVRVGSTKPVKVDVRVIAATNRDLKSMISNGQFRQDLYYRIATFEIFVPPLRDRCEDIPLLVDHFLRKHSIHAGLERQVTIEDEALDALATYDWPGNVRELDNFVHRLIVVSNGSVITWADVIREFENSSIPAVAALDELAEAKLFLPSGAAEFREEDTMKSYFRRIKLHLFKAAIRRYQTRTAAAERLGISRESLKKQLRYLRLSAAGSTPINDQEEV